MIDDIYEGIQSTVSGFVALVWKLTVIGLALLCLFHPAFLVLLIPSMFIWVFEGL
jgi:hypothetical protein